MICNFNAATDDSGPTDNKNKPEVSRIRAMKEKTVTISLRIAERAARALHEDAKEQNVSVNTLANQILLAYADFDRFSKKVHSIKLASLVFKRLIDAATEVEVAEIGRFAGGNVPEGFMLAKWGRINVENALEALRELAMYGGLFEYSETRNEDGRRTLTMTHDLGHKGSIFLQNHIEALFAAAGKELKVVRFDDAVTAEI